MGYKSVLRSVAAAQRRSEREARRRQREFARKQKQVAKMQELERARFEVEQYENYIEDFFQNASCIFFGTLIFCMFFTFFGIFFLC